MKRFGYALALCLLLAGCEVYDQQPDYSFYQDSDRTLIFYMAMYNNSLAGDGAANINDILTAAGKGALSGGRVVVYRSFDGRTPVLMEVIARDGQAHMDTLVKYEYQNSSSPDVLRAVLDDAKRLAPGRSYGLVVGSHGSGWLPDVSVERTFNPRPRGLLKAAPLPSLGDLKTRTIIGEGTPGGTATEMALEGFAGAIHDGEFEYILFDACYMGEAEVVYALRNKTRWVVASPAEIISWGLPYDLVLSDLMASSARLAAVCRKYYSYYNNMSGVARSATIGLYDCSKMDRLAQAMRGIYASYRGEMAAIDVSYDKLQHFDRASDDRPVSTKFDMADLVHQVVPAGDPLRAAFDVALSQVVVYKASTSTIMPRGPHNSVEIPVRTFCGIALYAPADVMGAARNDYYFTTTAWGS